MAKRGDNIRKRSDGRWEGRFRYLAYNDCSTGKGNDGQRPVYKYKSVYAKTYNEVKEKLELAIQENAVSQYLGTDECCKRNVDLTFETAAEQWLVYIEENKKYSTYIKYRNLYKCHIEAYLKDTQIEEITYQLILTKIFISDTERKITNSLKGSIIMLVNHVLQYAADHFGCNTQKIRNRLSREQLKPVEIITRSEQVKFINYLYKNPDRSKMGIILCLHTGLRLGEICSLKWEDIDFEQPMIRVNRTVQRISVKSDGAESVCDRKTFLLETLPKSLFSRRCIPLSVDMGNLLKSFYQRNEEYVIGGGCPLEPRTYQNRLKKYLFEADCTEYNFHALRHTFATNCIDNGMDIKSLSEILGHCNVEITLNRYVHPSMETKRRHMDALSSQYGQICGQTSVKYNI